MSRRQTERSPLTPAHLGYLHIFKKILEHLPSRERGRRRGAAGTAHLGPGAPPPHERNHALPTLRPITAYFKIPLHKNGSGANAPVWKLPAYHVIPCFRFSGRQDISPDSPPFTACPKLPWLPIGGRRRTADHGQNGSTAVPERTPPRPGPRRGLHRRRDPPEAASGTPLPGGQHWVAVRLPIGAATPPAHHALDQTYYSLCYSQVCPAGATNQRFSALPLRISSSFTCPLLPPIPPAPPAARCRRQPPPNPAHSCSCRLAGDAQRTRPQAGNSSCRCSPRYLPIGPAHCSRPVPQSICRCYRRKVVRTRIARELGFLWRLVCRDKRARNGK